MEARIEQWGNSLALRIPPSVAQQMALAADAAVSLELRDGKLSVWPAEKPPLTLEQLLEGITPDNRHREWDTGPAVGGEAW